MLIACGNIILPLRYVFAWCYGKWQGRNIIEEFEEIETMEYESAAVWFMEDYDRTNPVTSDEGWDYWENLVAKHQDEPDVKKLLA
eukprot:CAMPEP_0201283228 /NCGR_PEP_ID=MMETSP1317-20130820/7997_1 /ASSEMBLY_ACC=CAM_ASM_000770 /TAXON_ID=187299 /ORGANISM="Undescribed Undescribed, Strain Undescribed" /LENGTH=84 /DNA_ID=CAMNT_0047598771 /DNA_START=271 /DNA_END=525 /DNA_ORIENTATION=+